MNDTDSVDRPAGRELHPGLHLHRYVSLTAGSVSDLYETLSRAFRAIRTEVTRRIREARQLPVLAVDEAHLLRGELLEELRLLTNYRMDSENRLCLLLAGHTELRHRLAMADPLTRENGFNKTRDMTPCWPDSRREYVGDRWRRKGARRNTARQRCVAIAAGCLQDGISMPAPGMLSCGPHCFANQPGHGFMKTMRKRILAICLGAIAASLSLAGGTADPAWSHTSSCPAGLDRFIEYRLFFGRSRQGVEVVSDAAWDAFLADEITPRFPDGLTVLDAAGQWRDSSGTVIRERAKLVIILAGPGGESLRHTEEIAEGFRRQFDQESVLRVIGETCVAFQ